MTSPHTVLTRESGSSALLAVGSPAPDPAACVERYEPWWSHWVTVPWPHGWPCPEHPVVGGLMQGQLIVLDDTSTVRVGTIGPYDPASASWRTLPPLPLTQAHGYSWTHWVTFVGNRLMVLSSRSGCHPSRQPRTVGFLWRPQRQVWQRWTVLRDGAAGASLLILRDGTYLMAGGVHWQSCVLAGDHLPSRLAYRFDPGS